MAVREINDSTRSYFLSTNLNTEAGIVCASKVVAFLVKRVDPFNNHITSFSLSERIVSSENQSTSVEFDFLEAIRTGELPLVDSLLQETPDLIHLPPPLVSPIKAALDSKQDEMAAHLFELGAISAVDLECFHHFYYACQYGLRKTIATLLSMGLEFSLTHKNARGYTCLHALLLNEHDQELQQDKLTIAKMLLQKEPALIHVKSRGQNTVLHMAAATGEQAFLKLFLEFGADINAKNSLGDTPLFQALHAETGIHMELIEQLIFHESILIDEVNGYGQTALALAIEKRQYPIALLLLSRGADIHLVADLERLKEIIDSHPSNQDLVGISHFLPPTLFISLDGG